MPSQDHMIPSRKARRATAWGVGRYPCGRVGCVRLGLSSQLLAAPILRPARRTCQARTVVIFQRHSLGSGGDWGFRAGLTEPLPGHERCVLELAATEPG